MVKFDTLDKKPKLYDLLILAAVFAVIFGFLMKNGDPKHALAVCVLTIAFCLFTAVRLLIAFRRQLRYNPYSYNTIYYFGFAVFVIVIAATQVLLLVQILQWPEWYGFEAAFHLLLGSAENFMLLTSPFLFAFSIALCVSNISLIRHEGRRLVNVLGIILAVLLVAGVVFIYRFNYFVSGSIDEVRLHTVISNLFAAVYLYFECMLLGAIVAGSIAARHEPTTDRDYLIILGCGLKRDGTPTPLLRGRIDRAIAFAEKQKKETGKEIVFVTSGGKGSDEVISESASMKKYLMEQGIPEERIIEEDRSANTFENMKYSKTKIWEIDPNAKVAFSTTNYHVFRSGLFARRVKMRAVGMGAKTKWYFWPNAAVREFVGILTEHRVKQAVILGSIVAAYILMSLASYRA